MCTVLAIFVYGCLPSRLMFQLLALFLRLILITHINLSNNPSLPCMLQTRVCLCVYACVCACVCACFDNKLTLCVRMCVSVCVWTIISLRFAVDPRCFAVLQRILHCCFATMLATGKGEKQTGSCIGLARTLYKYGVYTALLAENSPSIRSNTVYIYGSGQPKSCNTGLCRNHEGGRPRRSASSQRDFRA